MGVAGAGGLLAKQPVGLALQQAARRVRQLQRAEGFAGGPRMAQCPQLADGGAPLLFIELAADAKNGYSVMPELLDTIRQPADQNIDQMHGAETLTGAIGAGQQFLGDDLAVAHDGWRQAVVAIAAAGGARG